MYISLADYSCASIDQLGVCFLNSKADYHSSDAITDLNPVYMNIDREVGNDIKNWHRVTVTYKSHGGELYLLFGSFDINKIRKTKLKAPKEVKTRINQVAERDAYYFIDDVSLVEIHLKEPVDTLENPGPEKIKEIPSDTLLVLKTILFKTNETMLLLSSCAELDAIANYLKGNPQDQIEIFGYTDNSGDEKTRITYNGYGSLNPVSSNVTEKGKRQKPEG